jgi:hypothetical protein
MTPEIESALRAAASELACIDPDIVTLPVFREIVDAVISTDPNALAQSAEKAVREMKRHRPVMFKEQDFEKMTSAQYYSAEAKLKATIRKAPKPSSAIPKDLDWATDLSADEFEAADKYLRGASNDTSVFKCVEKRKP